MLKDYRWSWFGESFFFKKKAPTTLEPPFLIIIMFCYLYNSLRVLPFPILHPPPLAF